MRNEGRGDGYGDEGNGRKQKKRNEAVCMVMISALNDGYGGRKSVWRACMHGG